MTLIEVVFWLSVGGVGYTYFGYPLVLIVLTGLRQLRGDWAYVATGKSRRAMPPSQTLPSVAVLVAAHNEERDIAERIRNLLALDYPAEQLHIYVGSDGSSDGTEQEAAPFVGERVHWHGFQQRRGKPSVLNDLAAVAKEDLLVFTDANTSFEAQTVARLVGHFGRRDVGCVCGELRLVANPGCENPDHLYWRYERLLKFFEARLGVLLGANGGVYAIRRELFQAIPSNTIVDDFWISMSLNSRGYQCVYDPEARATEMVPPRISDEFRRRVRIGIGNFQALRQFAHLLKPAHGYLAVAFFSHKCLRWFVPHLMIIALASNFFLAVDNRGYQILIIGQLFFYALAVTGYLRGRGGSVPGLLRIPAFFVGMNLALLVGFWKYLTGRFGGTWARTER